MLEQKNKSRARVRLAVFFVLSVHVVGLMALLMQGCRKPQDPTETMGDPSTNSPSLEFTNAVSDTNLTMTTPTAIETNTLPVIPPTTQEYAVMRGDNLSGIAKKFGVTLQQLQEANPGVVPTKLQIGQKLQIPAATAITPAATTPTVDAGGEMTYTVKSGDTLTKIANDHGTTIRAIRSANNLTTDKIVVGQKLKIPAKTAPATGTETTPVIR